MKLLDKVIKSPMFNLPVVTRYSGVNLIKSESVSDHVWGMCSLALELIPELNLNLTEDLQIDLKDVLFRIIVHDLDESVTCDIPRPFKYATKELREEIEVASTLLMKKYLNEEIVIKSLNAKEGDSIEAFLVRLFDLMQSGIKMRQEVLLGNTFIKTEVPNVIECLEEYAVMDYPKIKDTVSAKILKEFINSFLIELKCLI